MTTMEKARQYAAQAWCDPETSGKVMDPELVEAFARRLAVLIDLGDDLADLAVWMSGSADFSASGQAGVAWTKQRETLARAIRFLADPASPKAREASFAASPPAPAEGEREAGFREGLVAAAALVYGWQDADKNLTCIADAICGLTPGVNPECYSDPDAANQAFDDLRRERDALRRVGAEVVAAYRACREANSMAGFWTHLDDLAALLDGRASPRPPSSPDPTRCPPGCKGIHLGGDDWSGCSCGTGKLANGQPCPPGFKCDCPQHGAAPSPDPAPSTSRDDARRSCLWHADCDLADRALREGVSPSHPPMWTPPAAPADQSKETDRE